MYLGKRMVSCSEERRMSVDGPLAGVKKPQTHVVSNCSRVGRDVGGDDSERPAEGREEPGSPVAHEVGNLERVPGRDAVDDLGRGSDDDTEGSAEGDEDREREDVGPDDVLVALGVSSEVSDVQGKTKRRAGSTS